MAGDLTRGGSPLDGETIVVSGSRGGPMVASAQSVQIARSPDEVFAYVADIRNEPTWHVDMASVPADTDAVPVVGKTYPVTFKPFMGKTDGTYTILEFEPGHRVVYRASLGGFEPQITHAVDPSADGTRFTRSVDMRPTGLMVLMTPVMAVLVPRRNRVFVENLKRVLEEGAG
jgi:uncharacterized protein YndB with AHSA1/START domain